MAEVGIESNTMTPTLFGRWQTRLFLLATVGVVVTLPFALGDFTPNARTTFFWVLGYIACFGLAWDVLYHSLQQFRWDHDWPGALQLLAGIWEAGFLASLIKTVGLPGIGTEIALPWFALHYSLVWVAVYLAAHSLMRIIFPRWRFRGGQWW